MYINRVIIPDEKVKIRISGSHLLVKVLYKCGVITTDRVTRHRVIEIGLTVEAITAAEITVAAMISLMNF